jgi:predicted deacylase
MEKANRIQLGTANANPGEKAWGVLRVKHGKKSVRLPVGVIHGLRPGPHFVAIAVHHGRELNGFASIRSFVGKVDPARLRGTIFAIPCANPLAAMMRSYAWPESRHRALVRRYGSGPYPALLDAADQQRLNMQRVWPGRANGLFVERVVHKLWTRAVNAPHRRADFVIDLHCFQRESASAVYLPDSGMIPFGLATGLRCIVNMSYTPAATLCTAVCRRAGIPALIIESSGQGCVTPDSAEEGECILFNLVRYMRMLQGPLALPDQAVILDPWRDQREPGRHAKPSVAFEYARRPGLFIPYRWPYDVVRKGEIVSEMVDLYTGRTLQTLRAPFSGCLYDAGAGAGVREKGERLMGVSIFRQVRPRDELRQRPFTSMRQG